jgi:hypothetical protein
MQPNIQIFSLNNNLPMNDIINNQDLIMLSINVYFTQTHLCFYLNTRTNCMVKSTARRNTILSNVSYSVVT